MTQNATLGGVNVLAAEEEEDEEEEEVDTGLKPELVDVGPPPK